MKNKWITIGITLLMFASVFGMLQYLPVSNGASAIVVNNSYNTTSYTNQTYYHLVKDSSNSSLYPETFVNTLKENTTATETPDVNVIPSSSHLVTSTATSSSWIQYYINFPSHKYYGNQTIGFKSFVAELPDPIIIYLDYIYVNLTIDSHLMKWSKYYDLGYQSGYIEFYPSFTYNSGNYTGTANLSVNITLGDSASGFASTTVYNLKAYNGTPSSTTTNDIVSSPPTYVSYLNYSYGYTGVRIQNGSSMTFKPFYSWTSSGPDYSVPSHMALFNITWNNNTVVNGSFNGTYYSENIPENQSQIMLSNVAYNEYGDYYSSSISFTVHNDNNPGKNISFNWWFYNISLATSTTLNSKSIKNYTISNTGGTINELNSTLIKTYYETPSDSFFGHYLDKLALSEYYFATSSTDSIANTLIPLEQVYLNYNYDLWDYSLNSNNTLTSQTSQQNHTVTYSLTVTANTSSNYTIKTFEFFNNDPIIVNSNPSLTAGSSLNLYFNTSETFGNNENVSINWGDQTFTNITNHSAGSYIEPHTYNKLGTYTISINVSNIPNPVSVPSLYTLKNITYSLTFTPTPAPKTNTTLYFDETVSISWYEQNINMTPSLTINGVTEAIVTSGDSSSYKDFLAGQIIQHFDWKFTANSIIVYDNVTYLPITYPSQYSPYISVGISNTKLNMTQPLNTTQFTYYGQIHYTLATSDPSNISADDYTYNIPNTGNLKNITVLFNNTWNYEFSFPANSAVINLTHDYVEFVNVSGVPSVQVTFVASNIIANPYANVLLNFIPSTDIFGSAGLLLPTDLFKTYVNGIEFQGQSFSGIIGDSYTLQVKDAFGIDLLGAGQSISPTTQTYPVNVPINISEITFTNLNTTNFVNIYAKQNNITQAVITVNPTETTLPQAFPSGNYTFTYQYFNATNGQPIKTVNANVNVNGLVSQTFTGTTLLQLSHQLTTTKSNITTEINSVEISLLASNSNIKNLTIQVDTNLNLTNSNVTNLMLNLTSDYKFTNSLINSTSLSLSQKLVIINDTLNNANINLTQKVKFTDNLLNNTNFSLQQKLNFINTTLKAVNFNLTQDIKYTNSLVNSTSVSLSQKVAIVNATLNSVNFNLTQKLLFTNSLLNNTNISIQTKLSIINSTLTNINFNLTTKVYFLENMINKTQVVGEKFAITLTTTQSLTYYQQFINVSRSGFTAINPSFNNVWFAYSNGEKIKTYIAGISGNNATFVLNITPEQSQTIYLMVSNGLNYANANYITLDPALVYGIVNASNWNFAGTSGVVNLLNTNISATKNSYFYANSSIGDYVYQNLNVHNVKTMQFFVYTSSLGDVFLFTNSAGVGQMVRLDGRWGTGDTAMASTSSWTSWAAPPTGGYQASFNVWYEFTLVNNTSNWSLYINDMNSPLSGYGHFIENYTIAYDGTYFGYIGDGAGSSDYTYFSPIYFNAPEYVRTLMPSYSIGSAIWSNNTINLQLTTLLNFVNTTLNSANINLTQKVAFTNTLLNDTKLSLSNKLNFVNDTLNSLNTNLTQKMIFTNSLVNSTEFSIENKMSFVNSTLNTLNTNVTLKMIYTNSLVNSTKLSISDKIAFVNDTLNTVNFNITNKVNYINSLINSTTLNLSTKVGIVNATINSFNLSLSQKIAVMQSLIGTANLNINQSLIFEKNTILQNKMMYTLNLALNDYVLSGGSGIITQSDGTTISAYSNILDPYQYDNTISYANLTTTNNTIWFGNPVNTTTGAYTDVQVTATPYIMLNFASSYSGYINVSYYNASLGLNLASYSNKTLPATPQYEIQLNKQYLQNGYIVEIKLNKTNMPKTVINSEVVWNAQIVFLWKLDGATGNYYYNAVVPALNSTFGNINVKTLTGSFLNTTSVNQAISVGFPQNVTVNLNSIVVKDMTNQIKLKAGSNYFVNPAGLAFTYNNINSATFNIQWNVGTNITINQDQQLILTGISSTPDNGKTLWSGTAVFTNNGTGGSFNFYITLPDVTTIGNVTVIVGNSEISSSHIVISGNQIIINGVSIGQGKTVTIQVYYTSGQQTNTVSLLFVPLIPGASWFTSLFVLFLGWTVGLLIVIKNYEIRRRWRRNAKDKSNFYGKIGIMMLILLVWILVYFLHYSAGVI